jgi:hypothetical protein
VIPFRLSGAAVVAGVIVNFVGLALVGGVAGVLVTTAGVLVYGWAVLSLWTGARGPR